MRQQCQSKSLPAPAAATEFWPSSAPPEDIHHQLHPFQAVELCVALQNFVSAFAELYLLLPELICHVESRSHSWLSLSQKCVQV
jgi:hypothetical protein